MAVQLIINRRLSEHKLGKTKSLRKLLPIKLMFSQEYKNTTQAREIEYKLKSFKNKKIIERIINDKEIKILP